MTQEGRWRKWLAGNNVDKLCSRVALSAAVNFLVKPRFQRAEFTASEQRGQAAQTLGLSRYALWPRHWTVSSSGPIRSAATCLYRST